MPLALRQLECQTHRGWLSTDACLVSRFFRGIPRRRRASDYTRSKPVASAWDMEPFPCSSRLRNGRVSVPGQVYIVTAATSDRKPWFSNFWSGCAASRAISQASCWPDARPIAWVLMPDHAHFLIELGEVENLSRVVQRLKALISVAIRQELQGGQLWQRSFHDHALRSTESVQNAARYLIANPIRAGIVADVGDYPFWNAAWLEPGTHPLDM